MQFLPAPGAPSKGTRMLLLLCLIVLIASSCYALVSASHWPLVSDTALLRYAVFLIQHGHAPYAQVVDINLPGSYLLEATSMKLFGPGATGLRLYDLALSLTICILMAVLSRPDLRSRLFGLSAGLFFLLVHLQDGLAQAGQRDLAMAALALASCAVLLRPGSLSPTTALVLFELIAGSIATIKPTLLPLALLPFLPLASERILSFSIKNVALALAGLLTPIAAVLLWLRHWHTLPAFLHVLSTIFVLHSQLGHRTLGFQLGHCTSPILLLLLLWLATLTIARFSEEGVTHDPERWVLLFAIACGLLSYLAQGKAYPYQRYSFLAFCLLLVSRDLSRDLRGRAATRIAALATVCVACLGFAPRFAHAVASFNGTDAFQQALAHDPIIQSAKPQSIQCFDTFGGCIATLYDLRAIQSTGFLYDCYLFGAPSRRREVYRAAFLEAFDRAQPGVLVLTDQFCFNSPPSFDRLESWPELNARVQAGYTLSGEWQSNQPQRWMSRPSLPAAYRIFLRR